MSKLFVKPAVEGAMVRQPDRDMTPLSQDGAWVADTMFWRRRILLGDVVEAEPPTEGAAVEITASETIAAATEQGEQAGSKELPPARPVPPPPPPISK